MEQNLFNQNNQLNPIKHNNIKFEYTTKQIADGFECSETTIRDCKSNNKDYFIEGMDWSISAVGDPTGAKYTIFWSKDGIIKLASKLKLTPKAIEFLIEIKSEEKKKFNVPKTYSEALRLAANQAEQIEQQQKQLEEQKPKVQFAEKVSSTENAVSIGDYAKAIGWGQNKLFAKLRDIKILNDNNIPYQRFIDAGYFTVIEWVLDAKNQAKFKTLITGKGQIYISERIK